MSQNTLWQAAVRKSQRSPTTTGVGTDDRITRFEMCKEVKNKITNTKSSIAQ